MNVDLFSFCIGGFVSGFSYVAIDLFCKLSDKLFQKKTGSSFRELYEDNELKQKGNED